MIFPRLAFSGFLVATALAARPPGDNGNDQVTSETLLLGSFTRGLTGTIVAADACETVYALTCSSASNCANGMIITATAAPSTYRFQYTSNTTSAGTTRPVSYSQDCSVHGPVNTSTATCNMYNGASATSSTRTTLSGLALRFANVTITGGVNDLAFTTGSCTASAIAATATIGGSAAALRSGREVLKVIVVPIGVAMAGAFV